VVDIATAAAGLLVGCGLTTRHFRRQAGSHETRDSSYLLQDVDPLIQDAARRWAAVKGRPEVAPLMADKLRTLYGIKYGNRRGARKRRWR
jgi:hypothetical protein